MNPSLERPLPVTDDHETGGFWQAATEERLVVCTCVTCGATIHLPKSYCHQCGSWELAWRDVRPTGTAYTWTVLHHSIHEAFPAPCTVVLVALDDDPTVRLVGYLAGEANIYPGMPLRVRFDHVEPGVTIPQWEPVHAG